MYATAGGGCTRQGIYIYNAQATSTTQSAVKFEIEGFVGAAQVGTGGSRVEMLLSVQLSLYNKGSRSARGRSQRLDGQWAVLQTVVLSKTEFESRGRMRRCLGRLRTTGRLQASGRVVARDSRQQKEIYYNRGEERV